MNTTAIGLFTFSLVNCSMRLPPAVFSDTVTAGWPFWSTEVRASIMSSPATMMRLLSNTGIGLPSVPSSRRSYRRAPGGTLPDSRASKALPSYTPRYSRVAVAPRVRLALAVSCTPGNCTTTRSTP